MRKVRVMVFSGWLGVAALLGAVLVGAGSAQNANPYNPSCAEVLRYGPDAFMDRYTEKNNDPSEVAYDDAAITWANCKYDANLLRLKNAPKLKARLVQLHKLEGDFIRYESELAYSAGGGGTMYAHGSARFQPEMQLHLERLIKLTTSQSGAAQSASIAARYATAKQKLEARLKRVQTPNPFTDGYTAAEVSAAKKTWLEYAKSYAVTYQRIRALVGSRVDATGLEVMQFLARGLWSEEL